MQGLDSVKDLVFETEYWQVMLFPSDQTYLGRSVIVLKRPCPDMPSMTDEEVIDFKNNVAKKLERAIRAVFGAELFNWSCLMNHSFRRSPPNPQVHWHLRPRYREVVNFAGETFTDPNFGYHYLPYPEPERKVNDEVRDNIIKAIKDQLGQA